MTERPPSYSDALHDCLNLTDDERREYLRGIPTSVLLQWTAHRGRPSSWCEVFRELIVAELEAAR